MALSLDDPDGLIVTSLIVAGVMGTVRYVSHGDVPPIRFGVGLVFSGIALSSLAEFAPHLAGGLAALVLVSSVLVAGAPVLDSITQGLSPNPQQPGGLTA